MTLEDLTERTCQIIVIDMSTPGGRITPER